MHIFQKNADLSDFLKSKKAEGQKIGFVPTMGALHDGHLSLIRQAKRSTDICVSSIFVNPTQFNDSADLAKYPKTINRDIDLLLQEQNDVLYLPNEDDVYPDGTETEEKFDLGHLDFQLEAAHRPGHFQGVAQVVKRLLQIVQPDRLFMGQKDYQQFKIIERLIELEAIQTQIVMCPIIRESSGLAMSSRNARLSEQARSIASQVYHLLVNYKEGFDPQKAEIDLARTKTAIQSIEEISLEYLELASADNLHVFGGTELKNDQNLVLCTAFYIEEIRLIDNLILTN